MIKAVIFDLDGVIVSTDEYHYQAWKTIADREGIYFDRSINERLRGVSRSESLSIILERAAREYSDREKERLSKLKNDIYKKMLNRLTGSDILPGVRDNLRKLKDLGVKIAIASSSKNTPYILKRINMQNYFDAVADGNHISKSKPDPEVYLLAASLIQLKPEQCLAVEDAYAGIDAAKQGGFTTLAVGYACGYERADYSVKTMKDIDLSAFITSGIIRELSR